MSIYAAGEKKNLNFNMIKFADLISKQSNTQVVIAKSERDVSLFLKKISLMMK